VVNFVKIFNHKGHKGPDSYREHKGMQWKFQTVIDLPGKFYNILKNILLKQEAFELF